MGVIALGFDFHPVGADDPVRPQEIPVFTEILCKIATFQWADVGIGPYRWSWKIAGFRGRTESSAPTKGIG